MKNIINKLVFGSLTVALSSCIGNYENINSNPYEAPDLSADGYALGSAMNNLAYPKARYHPPNGSTAYRGAPQACPPFWRIFCRF